jgi:formylglycine-generating enzyme required for sulfatase activity
VAETNPQQVTNSIGMKFARIPAGKFLMGETKELNPNAYGDESPRHEVTLTKAFYLGIYEVTQEQWEQVMGGNPSRFKGARRPVE